MSTDEDTEQQTFGGVIEGARIFDDDDENLFFEVYGWVWCSDYPVIAMQVGFSETSTCPVNWCSDSEVPPADLFIEQDCFAKAFKVALPIQCIPGSEDIDLYFLATLKNGFNVSGIFHCCHTNVQDQQPVESSPEAPDIQIGAEDLCLKSLLHEALEDSELATEFLDRVISDTPEQRQPPSAGDRSTLRHTALSGSTPERALNILFITDGLRLEPAGAGAARILNILSIFSNLGISVTLFPTVGAHELSISDVPQYCPHLNVLSGHNFLTLSTFLSKNMEQFSHIFVCHPHNLQYLNQALAALDDTPACKVVYDPGVVLSGYTPLVATATSPDSEQLLDEAAQADLVFTLNTIDTERLQAMSCQAVTLPGFFPARPGEAPHSARSGAIMVGPLYSNFSANARGLKWYLDEVIPRLKQFDDLQPEKLVYIGRSYISDFDARQDEFFTLLPEVNDLSVPMSNARVAVVPIEQPTGIASKALIAAGFGVPLVTTSAVAARLGWTGEVELLTADTPAAFARCIHRLSVDEDLWNQLRINALTALYHSYQLQNFQKTIADAFKTDLQTTHAPSDRSFSAPQPYSADLNS